MTGDRSGAKGKKVAATLAVGKELTYQSATLPQLPRAEDSSQFNALEMFMSVMRGCAV